MPVDSRWPDGAGRAPRRAGGTSPAHEELTHALREEIQEALARQYLARKAREDWARTNPECAPAPARSTSSWVEYPCPDCGTPRRMLRTDVGRRLRCRSCGQVAVYREGRR